MIALADISNVIFYTFSTIAQSLAGAIGLLGAFVLFRFQSIRTDMSALAVEIAKLLPPGKTWYLEDDEQYREFLRELNESLDSSQGASDRAKLSAKLDQSYALRRRFVLSFYLTAASILGSVLVLVFARPIAGCTGAARVVLVVGVGALMLCLGSYARLMRETLK